MAIQNPNSNLHLQLKALAECLDEPALHAIWPKVWMLENPKAAQEYMDDQRDDQIKRNLQIEPVVIARDLAVRYRVSSTHIGKLLTELRYQPTSLYVDGAQRRCWVRPGTRYPKLELHNFLASTL